MLPALERFINSQGWLDTLGDPLQKYISDLFRNGGTTGKQIQNTLNGTWLGHPLHPMLTDVPVGAWTCTFVLDTAGSLSGNESLQSAADITLATGLLAGVGTAITGWTDWSDTYGRERSVGLLHGLTMGTTVALYLGALVARLSGARKTGVALANLGYGLLAAGAYVGGDEVFDLGYGVNHTAFTPGPGKFTAVMSDAELAPNTPTQGQAGGTPVLLVKQDNQVYALHDTCPHAGCSLAGGTISGTSIICPCHGSQFDLRDGSVINGPATMPAPSFAVQVQGGQIEVKAGGQS